MTNADLSHILAGFTINLGGNATLYVRCRARECYWTHRLYRKENDLEVALDLMLSHRRSGHCVGRIQDRKELPDILSQIVVIDNPTPSP